MQSIDQLKDAKGHISKENLLQILPYGEKFLFLDEVVLLSNDKIVALKKVSGTEEYMEAHFTSFQLMPGVLVVEAMGQASTLLARYRTQDHKSKHMVAHTFKDARFFAPIIPGEEMEIEANFRAEHNKKMLFEGTTKVKGKIVAIVSIIVAIVDSKEFEKRKEDQ